MERGNVQTRTGAASAKKKSLFQKTDRAQRPGPREEYDQLRNTISYTWCKEDAARWTYRT